MTHAAQTAIAAAVLALGALAALHVLKRDLHPFRTMVSRYALGPHGWVMGVCFAALGVASACLFAALAAQGFTALGLAGLVFLLIAAIALPLAGLFSMDPVSTPPKAMSFSGRMHGIAFLAGTPAQLLSVLLLSLALGAGHAAVQPELLALAALTWLSFAATIVLMLLEGPGKPTATRGPGAYVGIPNRLFMIGYGGWLIAAALSLGR